MARQAECESCHTAIAAEWRSSLHHTSFTDPDIRRALSVEPDPFCVNCHAPEPDRDVGIGCVTCHQPAGDAVVAAPSCVSCHEFDFPDAKKRRTPLAMQRTVTEHAGRADTCTTCHMTKVNGHTDHRFPAARDDAMVKSAVAIRVLRDGPEAVISLAPGRIGHAFPTGDLFRRVRITVGQNTRYLERHYANRQELPGIVVRSEIADDRVQGGLRVVRLPIGDERTRVTIAYERADSSDDATAHVMGAIVLYDDEL